ncbi:HD-GYP domain-containing protein [Ureibacillus sp. FSL K6-8385]|nr:HD-GYP domain-containing protein [Ureibacillus terrenus]MED3661602.1 HD-GYP domain-containing protein [Ureibacillus terrenus]MED3763637.1 HD-GYP domain-containing protein [Ureibacillus terrenus]
MRFTMVKVNNIELGAVIAKDIYANTSYPIIKKNTPISYEHLHILKAFNIKEVPVLDESIRQSVPYKTIDLNEHDIFQENKMNQFGRKYLESFEQFKKEFNSWEAGSKIDIRKLREMVIPLMEKVLENRFYIFDLLKYSRPDDYIYHHCIATGLIAAAISNKLGVDWGYSIQMGIAGTLADCGMSKIIKSIRNKKDLLTDAELQEIRKHPIYSYSMIKDLPALKPEMKIAIFQHHERLDGSGYPSGAKMGNVLKLSQIIAVADTFHAMASDRFYRPKKTPFEVIETIKETEFGKLDVQVVNAMIDLLTDLPIGTKVELTNLEKAEVLYINRFCPTRPIVRLLKNREIVDLSKQKSLTISDIVTD